MEKEEKKIKKMMKNSLQYSVVSHFSLLYIFISVMPTGYQHRDGNGAYQTGFMISQGTIRRGSRCSTAKTFLRPVRKRKNFHIAMHSHFLQILIDPKLNLNN